MKKTGIFLLALVVAAVAASSSAKPTDAEVQLRSLLQKLINNKATGDSTEQDTQLQERGVDQEVIDEPDPDVSDVGAPDENEPLDGVQARDLNVDLRDDEPEANNSETARSLDVDEIPGDTEENDDDTNVDVDTRRLSKTTFGNSPINRQYLDNWSNAMYIPNPTQPLKSGSLTSWSIYAKKTGQIYFQVWRRQGYSRFYQLIAQTPYTVRRTGKRRVSAKLTVQSGDVIGFYFPGNSIIPFTGWECYSLRTLYVKSPSRSSVRVGSRHYFRFKQAGWNPCRKYSFSATVKSKGKTVGKWIGNKPVNRGELDGWTNAMYIPNPDRPIPSSGVISAWRFYAARAVPIYLQVFRKTYGTQYKLIAQTYTCPRRTGKQKVQARINVQKGDVIGFYFPRSSLVPFVGNVCLPVGRRTVYVARPSVAIGRTYYFRRKLTGWNPCRQYAFGALLGSNQSKREMSDDNEDTDEKWLLMPENYE